MIERSSVGDAHTQYRSLRTFYNWMIDEDEMDAPSPMARAPFVPEKPVPIAPDDLTKKLLDTCTGRNMVSRRDAAIIRILLDGGCRLGELNLQVFHVVNKGRKSRIVPFGARTAQALIRYLRVRGREKWTSSQMLHRYGASVADERAQAAHRQLSLSDKV